MAVPTNTVQTFASVRIREELSDVISLIDPTDAPFYSMCRKGKAVSRTPEWMIDDLADPSPTNAVVEGDDVAADAGTQPTRIRNVVQLMDKVVQTSSTMRAVRTAGPQEEHARQLMKRGLELRRDIEARISGNFASVLGNASTAGQMAGAESFITTNTSRGTNGANGGYSSGIIAAATDGTGRTATEALLKSVIAKAWKAGGKPSTILVGPEMKQKFSAFAGIATQYRENEGRRQATILGAADVYISDFGEHRIVPSRFNCYGTGRTRNDTTSNQTALVLTPESWAVRFLQPIKREKLAKTGHSDKEMISCELTLECRNEAENGVLADITV
jgi:hypothetical protein